MLTDRSKNQLLPLIKKYVNIFDSNEYEEDDDENVIMNENVNVKTWIFSDCFRSYQPIDFQNIGFILKLVNIAFGLEHAYYIQILSNPFGIKLNLLLIILQE